MESILLLLEMFAMPLFLNRRWWLRLRLLWQHMLLLFVLRMFHGIG